MLSSLLRMAPGRNAFFFALFLTLVTTLPHLVHAKTSSSTAQSAKHPTLIYAKGHNSSGWLPFTLQGGKRGKRIMIPAMVNGRKVDVVLDSGAPVTVLDRRFVSSLGLKTVGDRVAQGSGGSGQYGIVKGVVIRLGDLTIKNSKTVGVDLKPIENVIGHPLPMFLGGAAFKNAVVDIDFKKHRIAFRSSANFDRPPGMSAVALTAAGGGNHALDMQIEGQSARMLFDLGNSGPPALLFPRFWNKPSFLKDRQVSSIRTGGWGGMHSEQLTRLRDVRLAGATFGGVPAALKGMHSSDARSGKLDGNVGIQVLSRFHRIVVDFPHDEVLFGGPVDTVTPFLSNTIGLQFHPTDKNVKIRHVAAGSPAEKAGLQVGDVITDVQDVDSGKEIPLASDWVYAAPGRKLRLTLSNGRTVIVKSARYY